jgi:Sec-independent protein translocase protein TatA
MFSLGPGELTLVLVAVSLVFIAGRLPSLGDAIGRLAGKSAPKPGAPKADSK